MNSSPTHLVQQPKIDTTQQPAVTRYTRRVDVDDFEFIEGGNSHSFLLLWFLPLSQRGENTFDYAFFDNAVLL